MVVPRGYRVRVDPWRTSVKIYETYWTLSLDELQGWIRWDPDALAKTHGNSSDRLPLHAACRTRRFSHEALLWLVETYPKAASMRDAFGNLPLHYFLAQNAQTASAARVLLRLIEIHPEGVEILNDNGDLPLEMALRGDANQEIIRILLDRNPEAVKEIVQSSGCLPLHLFDSEKKWQVVQLLIDAYSGSLLQRDVAGDHLLDNLIALGKLPLERICWLIDKQPEILKSPDKNGRLTLHKAFWAKSKNRHDIIELLLDRYPEACCIRNKNGRLPLHCCAAMQYPHVETMRLLIDEHPQGLFALDIDGLLPLESFLSEVMGCQKDTERFEFLLTHSQESIRGKDRFGRLSLHRVCEHGYRTPLEVLQALVAAYPESVQASDRLGNFPLFYLCENNNFPFLGYHRNDYGSWEESSYDEPDEESSYDEPDEEAAWLDAIYYLAARSLPFLVLR